MFRDTDTDAAAAREGMSQGAGTLGGDFGRRRVLAAAFGKADQHEIAGERQVAEQVDRHVIGHEVRIGDVDRLADGAEQSDRVRALVAHVRVVHAAERRCDLCQLDDFLGLRAREFSRVRLAVFEGRSGSGKSTAIRALAALLPTMKVVAAMLIATWCVPSSRIGCFRST